MRREYLLTQMGIIVSGNNVCAYGGSQAPQLPSLAPVSKIPTVIARKIRLHDKT
jgi:hypothetical protein